MLTSVNHQQQPLYHLSLQLSDHENCYETVWSLAAYHLDLGWIGTCYLT